MVMVDTSVWIDYFNGVFNKQSEQLHGLLGKSPILIGDLILTEVLQGFHLDEHFRQAKRLLTAFPQVSLLGPTLAVSAAENYRLLRKKGTTVRKTIDVIIATYCIHQSLPLLYRDRDFDPMVEYLGLIPYEIA